MAYTESFQLLSAAPTWHTLQQIPHKSISSQFSLRHREVASYTLRLLIEWLGSQNTRDGLGCSQTKTTSLLTLAGELCFR